MPDWDVDENTKLERFLRLQKVQVWRIPVLVQNGGVKVLRKGREIRLKDERNDVFVNDKVRLVTPTPPKCAKALQQEATTNWRDYAVAPGTSKFDKRIAKVLAAQPRTIVLQSAALGSIQGFIEGIRDSDEIVHPIRHLIMVGHANDEGNLKIPLYRISADAVTYEDLEDAVTKKSVVLDMTLLEPRPQENGVDVPPHFLFLGCLIGREAPFMTKLKDALGGKITVIAPNHLMVGATLKSPPGEMFYMAYSFGVSAPKILKDRKTVAAAFAARGYVRENGTPVPASAWDKWLPKDPNAKPNALFPFELKNEVRLPVLGVKDNAPRRFILLIRELFKGGSTISLPRDTGKEADRKKAVKANLLTHPRYQSSHPFPEYVRFGFKTMDEFMDAWDWNFTYDKTNKALSFDPKRFAYQMLQPIATVAKGELVINCYLTGKTPKEFKGRFPIEQLEVTNKFYFSAY